MNHPGADEWMDGVRAAASDATSLAAPERAWVAIGERIDRGDTVVLPMAAMRVNRVRPAAIAAGLVLCAGMAAALVPQTGLRAWIERQLGAEPVLTPVPSPSPMIPETAELALSPVDGVLHVSVIRPSSRLQLRVRLTDDTQVQVRALGAAASAQFRAGTGRLEIEGAAGGEVVLSLPRGARLITIDVNGARAVELRGSRLTVSAANADTVGTEIILPVQ